MTYLFKPKLIVLTLSSCLGLTALPAWAQAPVPAAPQPAQPAPAVQSTEQPAAQADVIVVRVTKSDLRSIENALSSAKAKMGDSVTVKYEGQFTNQVDVGSFVRNAVGAARRAEVVLRRIDLRNTGLDNSGAEQGKRI